MQQGRAFTVGSGDIAISLLVLVVFTGRCLINPALYCASLSKPPLSLRHYVLSPSKNVSSLWAPFNHRCTEQLVELIVEDLELPEVNICLAVIAAAVPGLNWALERSNTASRPHDFKSFGSPMSLYEEEEWYSFSTQSTRYSPKEQCELEKREYEKNAAKAARAPPSTTVVVPSATGPPKRNTRQSSKATAPAPTKTALKQTVSVVSDDSDVNSSPDAPSGSSPAKPARAPKKKVKIDIDKDKDKPVASTSSSVAKGKGSATRLAKLTPDRIKKITQHFGEILARLVKDNETDLVPTDLNQFNLFNKADSEYFVVIVKKCPAHVYKFSSHQPETSINRTSQPDLAVLPPISKPVVLIPEETVTQLSFENAIAMLACSVSWSTNERFHFCDHHLTLQEILDFHACVASDVIEADDKLLLFIVSLHNATLRLAAATQTHADAVKSAEYYFAQLINLTHCSIHSLGTTAFLLRFTSSNDTPTVVQHINTLIEAYNKLPEANLKDLEKNTLYNPDPELTKCHLRHMFMLDEAVFAPKSVSSIAAEDDAETEKESAESEDEVVVPTPNPKTLPKKPLSSKSDSGKGKDKASLA
ncbi:hypothetical protein B0H13DRAFT_2357024 [Mycena leptocephala]|nr:hypothetical protein B0H13DRAFT_2357024 [Mycena leptocephala]